MTSRCILNKVQIWGLCVVLLVTFGAFRSVSAEITDYTGGALNGYQTIYELNIPTAANYSSSGPAYTVDNSKTANINTGLIENVGYYMVLGNASTTNWAFASMSPFTTNLGKMGVPTLSSGAVYQQYVQNLYYKSNVASLNAASGKTVGQGNIEFWPTNYQQANAANIPNANGGTFDFGDSRNNDGNYGSMQIHDYQNRTTVMAYNLWGGADGNGCVGIGNRPSGDPDWTHAKNAADYTTRQLGVYVKTLNFDAVTDTAQRAVVTGETANMGILYKYNVDTTNSGSKTTTQIDNTNSSGSLLYGMPLARTAYYYELTDKNGNKTYAYTSFDAMTNNQSKTGIPGTYKSGEDQLSTFTFQQNVSNMTVSSNVSGVVNGTKIQTGNVEIWGCNYATANSASVPGANGGTYDFGDSPNPGGYGSFQVHNYGASQTVLALNNWTSNSACVGIGNQPSNSPDWTFNNNANSAYSDVKLYVLGQAAIAPGMANVANAAQYSIVQGGRLTTQMSTNIQSTGMNYDIVNNLAAMQTSKTVFDRVGYYIEYSKTGDDLYYAFVSMDAFTNDLSKIGVPTANTGIFWQQTVKNLEVTSNVPASEGIITSGTAHTGYLEFWPSNYGPTKGSVIGNGSSAIYDINDSGSNTSSGHGSMQVHNLDTGETVFAVNHFNGTKQYGIGTNPNPSTNGNGSQADWTFDENKSGYKIANIYTFVRESSAVLTTLDAASGVDFYQRTANGNASVDVSGTIQLAQGATVAKIQASADGTNWVDLTIHEGGSYSGALDVDTGWHYLDVRAVDAENNVLTSTTTGKIGVGDIFITAGQSNSTNCGDAPQSTTSGNVVALNHVTGEWSVANDPQPGTINGKSDGSTRGSTWTSFGDTLSEMSGIPVGLVSVGWSGSNIGQWNPDNADTSAEGWDSIAFQASESTLFGRLAYAIEELGGEFAGILWHQGESDAGKAEEYYENALNDLIEASREQAGWDVPWGVALVSWRPKSGSREEGYIDQNIRDAQQAVIDGDALVFAGPDSDALLGDFRGINGNSIHFSELGLQEMGYLWAITAGKNILGLPEPSTWALMILGIAFLGAARVHRKRLAA